MHSHYMYMLLTFVLTIYFEHLCCIRHLSVSPNNLSARYEILLQFKKYGSNKLSVSVALWK